MRSTSDIDTPEACLFAVGPRTIWARRRRYCKAILIAKPSGRRPDGTAARSAAVRHAEGVSVVTAAGGDRRDMLAWRQEGSASPKKYSPAIYRSEGEARRVICSEGAMINHSARSAPQLLFF